MAATNNQANATMTNDTAATGPDNQHSPTRTERYERKTNNYDKASSNKQRQTNRLRILTEYSGTTTITIKLLWTYRQTATDSNISLRNSGTSRRQHAGTQSVATNPTHNTINFISLPRNNHGCIQIYQKRGLTRPVITAVITITAECEQATENSTEHGTTVENIQDRYQFVIAIISTIASILLTAVQVSIDHN